jgi:hypothetical protein
LRSESCSNWTWILRKGQALGNRIVQFLGQQVALLGNRQFLLARFQALVFDGHAEMLAEVSSRLAFPAPTPGGFWKIEIEDPQAALVVQDIEGVAVAKPSRMQVRNFMPRRRVDRIKRDRHPL